MFYGIDCWHKVKSIVLIISRKWKRQISLFGRKIVSKGNIFEKGFQMMIDISKQMFRMCAIHFHFEIKSNKTITREDHRLNTCSFMTSYNTKKRAFMIRVPLFCLIIRSAEITFQARKIIRSLENKLSPHNYKNRYEVLSPH